MTDKAAGTPIGGATVRLVPESLGDSFEVHSDGTGYWSFTFPQSSVERESGVPAQFELGQNYPNPFNPSTLIPFTLRRQSHVKVEIYTLLGQLLDAKESTLPAGGYSITWHAKGSAGVLFYALEAGGVRVAKKMIQLDGGNGRGLSDFVVHHAVISAGAAMRTETKPYLVIASTIEHDADTVHIDASASAIVDFSLETVHSRAQMTDLHNDVLELVVENGYELGIRHTTNHTDIPRLIEGGVDVQAFSAWIDPRVDSANAYSVANTFIDAWEAQLQKNSSSLGFARNARELDSVHSLNKITGVLLLEGGYALENSIDKLIALYNRGVRIMTLTWNNSLSWAISSADNAQSATVGLSDFGRQVIKTMDSLGMLIDVSHVGIKTIQDVLEITTNPIIASHSGARVLRDHHRNLTNDQIKAIADKGGVIGVVFYPFFLTGGSASIANVVQHINAIVQAGGVECVAIGSDFDGIGTTPVGLENVSKFPALTKALLQAGYSPADVKKMLGGNFYRVFKQVCK